MTRGEELVIAALRREQVRLAQVATRATAAVEEYMNAATELLEIRRELDVLVHSAAPPSEVLSKLDDLKRRETRAMTIRKKDLLKLLDRQSAADVDRDALGVELGRMEFRAKLRHGA